MSSRWCGGMEIQVHCQRLNRICFSRYAYSMKQIDGSLVTSDMSWRDRVNSYGPLVSSCIRPILPLVSIQWIKSSAVRQRMNARQFLRISRAQRETLSPVPESRIIRGSDRRRGERSGLSERERAKESQRGRERGKPVWRDSDLSNDTILPICYI